MGLKIRCNYDNDTDRWELYLQGEVDISTADELRSALDAAVQEQAADIALHFDELGYIDSTGLGVIIGAYGRQKEKGRRITIVNPQSNIKKLLRITSLDQIFCSED